MTKSEQTGRGDWLFRLRPYTNQVAAVRALFLTLVSLLRGGRREIWIGDSHAAAFLVGPTWAIFLAGPRGELVLRVGARLMHSLATNGFPPKVTHFVTLVRLLGRRDSFAPVFVAGEIDVRNSLATRPDSDYAFVRRYVAAALEVATAMKASQAYVLVPPPPRPRADVDPEFPSVGTDQERLAAFGRLRAALVDATRDQGAVTLIDLTDHLVGADGMMVPELTDDGCHTNSRARTVVRAALDAHPDFVRARR